MKLGDARKRLREAKAEGAEAEKVSALNHAVKLFAAETVAKKAAKNAAFEIDQQSFQAYEGLRDTDIRVLVIEDKWGDSIRESSDVEVVKTIRSLALRLNTLGERYSETLEQIIGKTEEADRRVCVHLRNMGVL
ncbi:hypothetical protein GCM10009604_11160 [Corynebacterium aurimucosum]|nr:hypothetical protein CAURIM_06070 [Corynebacterium aurimucosum]